MENYSSETKRINAWKRTNEERILSLWNRNTRFWFILTILFCGLSALIYGYIKGPEALEDGFFIYWLIYGLVFPIVYWLINRRKVQKILRGKKQKDIQEKHPDIL